MVDIVSARPNVPVSTLNGKGLNVVRLDQKSGSDHVLLRRGLS